MHMQATQSPNAKGISKQSGGKSHPFEQLVNWLKEELQKRQPHHGHHAWFANGSTPATVNTNWHAAAGSLAWPAAQPEVGRHQNPFRIPSRDSTPSRAFHQDRRLRFPHPV